MGWLGTIVGLFKDARAYRLCLLLSFVILALSLFVPSFPPQQIASDSVTWWSFWAFAFFLVSDIEGTRKSIARTAAFATPKLVAFLGFTYLIWGPWIALIDQGPLDTNEAVVAFLFFGVIGALIGASLSTYATFSCRRADTALYWYLGSVVRKVAV